MEKRVPLSVWVEVSVKEPTVLAPHNCWGGESASLLTVSVERITTPLCDDIGYRCSILVTPVSGTGSI